jgi:gas vesicle protein
MSQNGDGSAEFFKGLLFGGAIGAVIALLYAPRSGKETRDDLKRRSLELRDDAEAKLQLAQKKAEALLDDTKKQLDQLRKEAEGAMGDLKGTASNVFAEGLDTLEKEKNRIKEAIDAGVSAFKEEKSNKSAAAKKRS